MTYSVHLQKQTKAKRRKFRQRHRP